MRLIKEDNKLLLEYSPRGGLKWIKEKFDKNKSINLRKVFNLSEDDIYTFENKEIFEEDTIFFEIATLEGKYYKFNRKILDVESNLLIHNDVNFEIKQFIAQKNVSIFKKIDLLVEGDLIIGHKTNELPIEIFYQLISSFPNYYELKKYTMARISRLTREYLNIPEDAQAKYNKYMNNKKINYSNHNILKNYSEVEYKKYNSILQKLKSMLKAEEGYLEKDWQKEILQILQLLYPKYINVFEEVKIKDNVSDTYRSLDYLILDSNGHVDIIEIKKPSNSDMLSRNLYRDNHVPLRELSGAIMQVEKYIYMLNHWGSKGEKELLKRYESELPNHFKIKIVNPNGIIIMGRDKNFNEKQEIDFEIIKRKYKNIVDIITYDDLIERLERLIFKFSNI